MLNYIQKTYHVLGLNLIVNMKPHISLKRSTTINAPYNIKISTKFDMIDQKRGQIEVKPGFHLIIRVTPQVIEASEDFKLFDFQTNFLPISEPEVHLT